MKVTARDSGWQYHEGYKVIDEETKEEVQKSTVHTWTEGQQYEVVFNDDQHTVQFTSDAGETHDPIHVLALNQDLFAAVFDIDLAARINAALQYQKTTML